MDLWEVGSRKSNLDWIAKESQGRVYGVSYPDVAFNYEIR